MTTEISRRVALTVSRMNAGNLNAAGGLVENHLHRANEPGGRKISTTIISPGR